MQRTGAGEGIRTLDPNLGNIYKPTVFTHFKIQATNNAPVSTREPQECVTVFDDAGYPRSYPRSFIVWYATTLVRLQRIFQQFF